jgi:SAM-dependent methyltransferase
MMRVNTVVGIDANAAMLRTFTARLPGTNVILGSVDNPPLRRHSVHTAVATNLLHLHPRPTFVLERLADVVEPTGQIICSWPYDDAGPWRVARAELRAGIGIGEVTARTGGRLAMALTAPRSLQRVPSHVLSRSVETFARVRGLALTSLDLPVAQQSLAVLRGGIP